MKSFTARSALRALVLMVAGSILAMHLATVAGYHGGHHAPSSPRVLFADGVALASDLVDPTGCGHVACAGSAHIMAACAMVLVAALIGAALAVRRRGRAGSKAVHRPLRARTSAVVPGHPLPFRPPDLHILCVLRR